MAPVTAIVKIRSRVPDTDSLAYRDIVTLTVVPTHSAVPPEYSATLILLPFFNFAAGYRCAVEGFQQCARSPCEMGGVQIGAQDSPAIGTAHMCYEAPCGG